MDGLLYQAFIYLCAGVIAAPIAARLGLGSVLGYLLAGILIGPVFGLVGEDMTDVQHFAEFGVVMMLFIVGLELEPRMLWRMRWRLLGLGGLQIGLTVALAAIAGTAFGLTWQAALAIGLILSMSSTAIVLQTLQEKGLADTDGGRASFSVLLFQDIAFIPIVALLPLLAMPDLVDSVLGVAGPAADASVQAAAEHGAAHNDTDHGAHGDHEDHGDSASLIAGWPAWAQALMVAGSIAFVVFGGHYLMRPIFRFIAHSRMREVFTAAALLLVVGIALLMTLVGLSPALGTFLAGVVLANSEFRHELESDIEPFKGLLLGLFFMTVGAGVDFGLLARDGLMILGLTLGVMALKGAVLFALAKLYRLGGRDSLLLTLGLAQAGEFGFVLISFSLQNNVITSEIGQTLSLVVALSMMLTPPLFIAYDRFVANRPQAPDDREPDVVDRDGAVLIAGMGRFGQIVNRLLLSKGVSTVVLDHRSELIDSLSKFGMRGFYGDASRPDLLQAAGLKRAHVLVVAIDDKERAVDIVAYARRERPELTIIARAADRQHVYALTEAGADHVVRELFDASVHVGQLALTAVGVHPYEVEKHARAFAAFDQETLERMAAVWDPDVAVWDNAAYLAIVQERNALQEEALKGARTSIHDRADRGWSRPRDAEQDLDPDPGAKD